MLKKFAHKSKEKKTTQIWSFNFHFTFDPISDSMYHFYLIEDNLVCNRQHTILLSVSFLTLFICIITSYK